MRVRVRKIGGVWCIDKGYIGIAVEFFTEAIEIADRWANNDAVGR